MLEVEVKGRVSDSKQMARVRALVSGWEVLPVEEHEDCYYSHPCRDFSRTDEALRIRHLGTQCRLTYKGPKVDSRTKTREEIEFAVPESMVEVLKRLGFEEVRRMRKRRASYIRGDVTLSIDEVEGLGRFVEIELAKGGHEAAPKLLEMLDSLGMVSETRSYLELAMGP